MNEEIKNQEEVIEEVKKRDEVVDGYTFEEYIEHLRKEHKTIFSTSIEDDIYIWRKLKRSEYKDITKQVTQAFSDDPQAQNWYKQELVTKTVLLYPLDAEEAIEEAAGIPVVICQDCLIRSGFGAISRNA